MTEVSKGGDHADIWNKVLRSALLLPGVRVDRAAYLRKEFAKRVAPDVVEEAIRTTPMQAGVPLATVRAVATSSIKWHRSGVSAASFGAGLPGGWWMAATMPADVTQFFWHVSVVLQKLAYLHGWPEILVDGEEVDDETLHVFTMFIGAMSGAAAATAALEQLGGRLSKEVATRLPREALTKWALYGVAKDVAKWLGIKLTKETFARAVSKIVPIVGGLISGTITWFTFSAMSRRLATHLDGMALNGPAPGSR